MGFSKTKYEPTIRIEVLHQWHPDTIFAFTFPKRMPQTAAEAETRYLGINDEMRKDESRKALIESVAALIISEPEGFDDFPRLTEKDRAAEMVNIKPLAERMREYFDEPDKPELEEILSAAYRAYRLTAMSSAYPKSLQAGSAGDGELSRSTAQAPT